MPLLTSEKKQIIDKFKKKDLDTGSPEVQIALLTARIQRLTDHFKENHKDNHSRLGLLKMVSQRRSLLDYLKGKSQESYKTLIAELGIRK